VLEGNFFPNRCHTLNIAISNAENLSQHIPHSSAIKSVENFVLEGNPFSKNRCNTLNFAISNAESYSQHIPLQSNQ